MRYGRSRTSPLFGKRIGKLAQLADSATNKGDLEEYKKYREEIEQMLDDIAPEGWFSKPKVHPAAEKARKKHKERKDGEKAKKRTSSSSSTEESGTAQREEKAPAEPDVDTGGVPGGYDGAA